MQIQGVTPKIWMDAGSGFENGTFGSWEFSPGCFNKGSEAGLGTGRGYEDGRGEALYYYPAAGAGGDQSGCGNGDGSGSLGGFVDGISESPNEYGRVIGNIRALYRIQFS
jgi:hypothetical protein